MTISSAFDAFDRVRPRPSLATCSIDVEGPPDRSFDLFTSHFGHWWPIGATGPKAERKIVIEPKANGGFYEVRPGGPDHWGKVIAYVPGHTILLDWKLDLRFLPDPSLSSDVEIFFAQNRDQSSHVTIIHGRLEQLCRGSGDVARGLATQWRSILKAFRSYSRLHHIRATLGAGEPRLDGERPAGLY
jgi:uncharacterized protein YndB with AHSA1/START domain